jgi:hypothetical protein
MNSRKWQVGMTAIVVASLGMLAPVPFVWRYLRLREHSMRNVSVSITLAWLLAWVATAMDLRIAAAPIIIVWLFGSVLAAYVFRPLPKGYTIPERGV